MRDRALISEDLRSYLGTIARPGLELAAFSDTANLIDEGVIDSFALIQIIFWLEQNHGLDLQAIGIDPADLASIEGILDAIEQAES